MRPMGETYSQLRIVSWTAVASEARRRFGYEWPLELLIQSPFGRSEPKRRRREGPLSLVLPAHSTKAS